MSHYPKLGVTYSLFSGEEILPASLLSIRKFVDYVNVIYQKFSWFGDPCTPIVEPLLNDLKNKNLIDTVIEYPFSDFGNDERKSYYVIEKKNIGINDLKKNKCTHCLIMDVDELYIPAEFEKAKLFVINNQITHSACSIYDYRHFPEIRQRDCAKYAVPFIFKLNSDSYLTKNHNMPCHVDPLRTFQFDPLKHKFYYLNSLCMHHMTGIRMNFDKKLRASVTNSSECGRKFVQNFKKDFDLESQLTKSQLLEIKNGGGYVEVEDLFGLNAFIASYKNLYKMFC